MEYQGPEPADLGNVQALNSAFLDWLIISGRDCGLPKNVLASLAALQRTQLDRLARVPFLLVSLREHDDAYWDQIFAARSGRNLLADLKPLDDEGARLAAAALGFLWQLALRNPYTARLVSGASLHWCEQLAASTLIDLVDRAAELPGLLEARMSDRHDLWNKLLTSGLSSKRDVRHAARVSALQTVLTSTAAIPGRPLASAARRLPTTRLRLAPRPRH